MQQLGSGSGGVFRKRLFFDAFVHVDFENSGRKILGLDAFARIDLHNGFGIVTSFKNIPRTEQLRYAIGQRGQHAVLSAVVHEQRGLRQKLPKIEKFPDLNPAFAFGLQPLAATYTS